MGRIGIKAMRWVLGAPLSAIAALVVAGLASWMGLFRILSNQRCGPIAACPQLSDCISQAAVVLTGALVVSCTLALWMCWRRVAGPLSPRHLREVNNALRQKIASLQVQAAEQARSRKMEALAHLSGGVSHYVNNTVQVMGGVLALLAPRVAGDKTAQDLIALSLAAADRATFITGQLLLFAQQPASSPRPFDVQAFIDDLRASLKTQLGPGIVLVLEDWSGQPELPLFVDKGEIMQMVANLVTNAQEAMAATGTLTIELGAYFARDRADLADGYYLRVKITDDGHGLAPHLAEQAMDPFVSAKPVGLAAGLGLCVVYGIARRAGGIATLESMPQGGTTASVYLRLAVAEAAMDRLPEKDMDAQSHEVCEDFDGLRVMLVDDEAETRAIVAITLETLGCVVERVSCGEQALALTAQGSPDLFILDYAMPGMNGAQLACALRARDGVCRIVFLTGFADRVAIEAAIGTDVVMVHKPASRTQLARAIADALA
jgi:signal transduction histidine kinase/CheY-like chemotaxis protein